MSQKVDKEEKKFDKKRWRRKTIECWSRFHSRRGIQNESERTCIVARTRWFLLHLSSLTFFFLAQARKKEPDDQRMAACRTNVLDTIIYRPREFHLLFHFFTALFYYSLFFHHYVPTANFLFFSFVEIYWTHRKKNILITQLRCTPASSLRDSSRFVISRLARLIFFKYTVIIFLFTVVRVTPRRFNRKCDYFIFVSFYALKVIQCENAQQA